jgi:copper homeostasis protein
LMQKVIIEMNKHRKFILEIVCANIPSVIEAKNGGADRIELCANLEEGGTTPSFGTIYTAKNIFPGAIHVLIRARSGDFLYSEEEFSTMKEDILACKNLRVDGIVTGILLSNGHVDVERTRELVDLARPMQVTFHRAFDVSKNPLQSLEDVISTGCSRLLTSGQSVSALQGASLIGQLITQAANRIIVMPGAGINADNVEEILQITGAIEIHSSCKTEIQSKMIYKNNSVKMGGINSDEYTLVAADSKKIRELKNKAEEFITRSAL